ncbi:Cation/H(+) antiporter 15 [Sesamum alatum]|uniref:Cation/H(+) antiporter 15 n=1 Tax=Sesamum alatum TaxID=300844 RepID=A0AAE1Y359_9LAMI|nr:Cation/H(+) antiporter 15 [Sesamum alatum]
MQVLDDKTFAIMVIVALVMTSIVQPGVTTLYRPARKHVAYKRRTIQRTKPDGEFRVLVCVHTPRNVPTMIHLLEASHPTKKSPITTYVLHLVELSGRASAVHIVQYTRKAGRPAINRMQAQSDHIFNAFQNFEQQGGFVSVTPFTAISQYSTIHEDICNLAQDKRAAVIIIPFHKQQTVDGRMEDTNSAFRMLNQNVLANAPCSVGILVDRGLSGPKRSSQNQILRIAVLFFGGPDDREALAYAWRLSQHPRNNITVMRFVLGDNTLETTTITQYKSGQEMITVETDDDREKQLDDKCIQEFKGMTTNNSSVTYMEKVVNHGEQTVAAIRTIDGTHDLFIVGRGHGMMSPFTAGLSDWRTEAIGDTTICMPDSPTQQQGQRRSPPQDTAVFQPQP